MDAMSYGVSFLALASIRSMPPAQGAKAAGISSILEGFRYAGSRPELIGTYIVDIIALTFAMPLAVFPALAARLGGAARRSNSFPI
jgi:ABC-type phosphate transport system permease subunit